MGFSEKVSGFLTKIVTTLAVALLFINFFSGIVGGIWLCVLGYWKFVVGTFVLDLFMPLPFGLLMLLFSLPTLAIAALVGDKTKARPILSIIVGAVGMTPTMIFMLAWIFVCFFLFTVFGYSRDNNMPWTLSIPLMLWTYSFITSPPSYLASKERDNEFTMVTLFYVQLITLSVGINFVLFGNVIITILLVIPLLSLLLYAINLSSIYQSAKREKQHQKWINSNNETPLVSEDLETSDMLHEEADSSVEHEELVDDLDKLSATVTVSEQMTELGKIYIRLFKNPTEESKKEFTAYFNEIKQTGITKESLDIFNFDDTERAVGILIYRHYAIEKQLDFKEKLSCYMKLLGRQ